VEAAFLSLWLFGFNVVDEASSVFRELPLTIAFFFAESASVSFKAKDHSRLKMMLFCGLRTFLPDVSLLNVILVLL